MTDTIEKVRNDINDLVSRCNALEAEKQFPQIGNWYFYHHNGMTLPSKYTDSAEDKIRRGYGNFLKTEQEAQQELDCQLVDHEMRRCEGRVSNRTKVADYAMVYGINVSKNGVAISSYTPDFLSGGLFNIMFLTVFDGEAAIEKVGKERILAAAKWKAERPVY